MHVGNDDYTRLLRVGSYLELEDLSHALREASEITKPEMRMASAIKFALYHLDHNRMAEMHDWLVRQPKYLECYRRLIEQRPARLNDIALPTSELYKQIFAKPVLSARVSQPQSGPKAPKVESISIPPLTYTSENNPVFGYDEDEVIPISLKDMDGVILNEAYRLLSQGKLKEAYEVAKRVNSTVPRETLYLGLIDAYLKKGDIPSFSQAIAIGHSITISSLQLSASLRIGKAAETLC